MNIEVVRPLQVRAIIYVTTLASGIMESMASLEKAVIAALGPRHHKKAAADREQKAGRVRIDAVSCVTGVRRPKHTYIEAFSDTTSVLTILLTIMLLIRIL